MRRWRPFRFHVSISVEPVSPVRTLTHGDYPSLREPVPLGDFVFEQEYGLVVQEGGWSVADASGSTVAVLPGRDFGRVATGAGEWMIAPEEFDRHWALVARNAADRHLVARASRARWHPTAYELWLGGDLRYRLSRNLLTGTWTLKNRQGRLARLSSGKVHYPAMITIKSGAITTEQLDLLIVIALETTKFEAKLAQQQLWAGA